MEESVGQVLLKVQDDLGRLREQLAVSGSGGGSGSGSGSGSDQKALREALAKAENDLRLRSEDVLSRMAMQQQQQQQQQLTVRLPQIRLQGGRQQQQPSQQQQQLQQQTAALPTVIPTREPARGGILALMERGAIPPAANVVLEPQPIKHRPAPVHEPAGRTRDRFPADAADPGYSQGGYQLDDAPNRRENLALAARSTRKPQQQQQHQTTTAPAAQAKVHVRQFEPPLRSIRSGSGPERPPLALMPPPPPPPPPPQQQQQEDTRVQSAAEAAAAAPPPPTTPASLAATTAAAARSFALRHGVVRPEAADFRAFRQRCELLDGLRWETLERLLRQLERLLQKFAIPVALVSCERLCDLAELCSDDEADDGPVEDAELLDCLVNRADVLKLMRRPGRQFVGPGGIERACVTIQKQWRGYLARCEFRRRRQRNRAAVVIEGQWHQYKRLLDMRSQLKRTRLLQLENYKRRFGQLQESWARLQTRRRVVVHLPSLGFSEKIRRGFPGSFSRAQNTQMARLCDARDPNVDVVLVTPVPLDDEMTQYYGRLLGGLGPDGAACRDRYKIVVPEAAKAFAGRSLPLATLLGYSPRALRRIRNLIQGRPAFIVPGYPCQDDLAVADKLDLPILCPEPQVTQLYGTKSGGRRIFQAAGVTAPPGDFDVYSMTQLLESLAQLVTCNLSVTRWLLKVDTQFDGRGIGYVDVDRLPCYRWALRERQRYGDKWDKKWAHEKVYLKVYEELPDLLKSPAAQVACQDAYASWEAFQQEFLSQGGVIEACPPAESVTQLTVDLCIDPNGTIRLLSSGDQLTSRRTPFACLGVSSPQSSVQPDLLNALCRRIGEACRERRIFGHASIDFVTFESADGDSRQEVWATDLSLHYSDSAALSQLFYMAAGGSFDPATHEVFVSAKTLGADKAKPGSIANKKQRRPPKDTGRRYATMSSRLCHSGLAKLQFAAFFKTCKAHGIEFDTERRTGSLFCLVDPFNRDAICMATISADLLNSMETFARNLTVLDQEASNHLAPSETNFHGLVDELDVVIAAAKENAAVAAK